MRRQRHTGRRWPYDRGRDWSDTSASQGTPRTVGKQQKLEAKKDSFL